VVLPRSREGQPAPAAAPGEPPAEIQSIGWKAQVRLCKRYRQLTARGKHANQVVVAITREMAAFAWGIARTVPLAS
jgi:transposase